MAKIKRIKVIILMGGPSSEYEVSLNTGKNILTSLDKEKYEAEALVIDKKGNWPAKPADLKNKFDIAFIAMHGPYGEDGTAQSILEEVQMPYTGSNIASSALGMNKFLSSQIFRDAGLKTPHSLLISKIDWRDNKAAIFKKIALYLERPLVVKPNYQGSSIGVSIIKNLSDLEQAIEKAFNFSRHIIVQSYISGREMACGVLDFGWLHSVQALPPTEIIPLAGEFFNYQSKYNPQGAHEITPACLPASLTQAVQRTAVIAHKLVGCRAMSRTDMILGKDNQVYILEINTIPGMTENSLLPKAAQAAGLSFSRLLDRIIQASLPKHR